MTLLGDLYSRQPVCEAVLEEKFNFIFTCKADSHKTLYEHVEYFKKTEKIPIIQVKRWTGKRYEIDQYCYVNKVPLRDTDDALLVNWCELITTDQDGKVLYHNTFVTNHVVNDQNVKQSHRTIDCFHKRIFHRELYLAHYHLNDAQKYFHLVSIPLAYFQKIVASNKADDL